MTALQQESLSGQAHVSLSYVSMPSFNGNAKQQDENATEY